MAEKLARKGNRIVHSIVDSRVTLRGAGRRAEGKYFYFLKSESLPSDAGFTTAPPLLRLDHRALCLVSRQVGSRCSQSSWRMAFSFEGKIPLRRMIFPPLDQGWM